ncbi:CoxG family protein [Diaphorobacter caeni]|uniref:CoxG family protein n=1 Tax=Diaphorobacter caeni TaxID=2784387 RepID=UPI001890AA4B|nr:carbon monoxide dehydrogenase subunit G [Diaphorobacter caeni]MBF5006110.1 carbon monoxide dehydrogenase subunit G [Diaphorobacter caeni]
MDMQSSRQLAVSQQQAWDALNDPEVLKLCIPGCDRVEATGENQYAIGMALKIGPVSAKFSGQITLADIAAPQSYTIAFDGQGGAAGFGKGSAKVQLHPNDEGCELAYTVNAQVGGKVAQLGQRLIDGAAKSLAEDFFKRFDKEMQRRFGPPPDEEAAAAEKTGMMSGLMKKMGLGKKDDAPSANANADSGNGNGNNNDNKSA